MCFLCNLEKYYRFICQKRTDACLYCIYQSEECEELVCCAPYQCCSNFCGDLCDCDGCCCQELEGETLVENSGQVGKRLAKGTKNVLKKLWQFIKIFTKLWNILFSILLLIVIFIVWPVLVPIVKPVASNYYHYYFS